MKRMLLALAAMAVGVVMASSGALAAVEAVEDSGGETKPGSTYSSDCGGTFLGLRPWYADLPMSPAPDCTITTPGQKNLPGYVWGVVTNILYDLFVLVGYLAVGFIIFGGYTYLLARGDPGRIEKGKKTIVSAVSGLIIAVLASLIVSFIGSNILGGL